MRQLYRSRVYPNLVVTDKENGGKADALNADTLIEPDALLRMVRPFLLDDRTLAACGTIRVINDCTIRSGRVTEVRLPRRFVAALQVVEYLRAFLFGRLGWNRLGGNLIISGAFGLFRRDIVIEAGGYLHDTVGEDIELVARLRRSARDTGGPDRVAFVPDPVAWTEVPESLRVLRRQRDRWHRGLADTLWRHRGVTLNPRYGVLDLFVFPCFVFVELIAPVIELAGLVGLCVGLWIGALNTHFDSLGYRQLTVAWRVQGLTRFLRGRRDWGVMERRGLTASRP